MYDLRRFTLSDMTECSSALRKMGNGAKSMEEVAKRVVNYFYNHLVDKKTGEKLCALVRFYKTHPYAKLDSELRGFANAMLSKFPDLPTIKCLTLLATTGKKPEWNSRRDSVGHKAIPLPSEEVVLRFPMISQLIIQLGLDIGTVLKPRPTLITDMAQKAYNVFHVSEAVGSPYIPAQKEFVIPFGIKSVLGFGGMLPSGDLFAVIMFSKCYIPRETAIMFRTLTLSVKIAVLSFDNELVFA